MVRSTIAYVSDVLSRTLANGASATPELLQVYETATRSHIPTFRQCSFYRCEQDIAGLQPTQRCALIHISTVRKVPTHKKQFIHYPGVRRRDSRSPLLLTLTAVGWRHSSQGDGGVVKLYHFTHDSRVRVS